MINRTWDIAVLVKLVKTGMIMLHEIFEHEIGFKWKSVLYESCKGLVMLTTGTRITWFGVNMLKRGLCKFEANKLSRISKAKTRVYIEYDFWKCCEILMEKCP